MTGFCYLNLKFLLILAILVFMGSFKNFMLCWVEREKSFITLDLDANVIDSVDFVMLWQKSRIIQYFWQHF